MEGFDINQPASRRQIALVSAIGTTQLHLRNPWVIACWSMLFPGSGHYLLSKKIVGYLLFIWELFINYKAHINLAIFHSLIGNFDIAKEVLNIQWMLLYLPTYFFAIWNSYRNAVDLNMNYLLAAREDAPLKPFKIINLEINYLDKRSPLTGLAWSTLMPGTGLLYNHQIFCSLFILSGWITNVYFSNFLPAIQYSFMGNFELAKTVIDPQWLLNIPSIYMFSIYASYVKTVENNSLYEWEQSKFLKKHYQDKRFTMPALTCKGEQNMYIVSTFEHSKYLELAITNLQMKGIAKEKILAVPLDKKAEDRKLFDTVHSSDGLSLLDLPFILATYGALFGGIYGFIWRWGPIIWGLIGFVICFIIGIIIKLILTNKYKDRQKKSKTTDVVVIIECLEEQTDMIRNILWEHQALGVRKLDFIENN